MARHHAARYSEGGDETIKKLIAAIAVLFAVGGTGVAVAAVNWPTTCSSFGCVNNHLNDLNARVKALNRAKFSQRVVVTYRYVFDDPVNRNRIETVVPCGTPDPSDNRPFKGWATSGGVNINGPNDWRWHVVSSGPPNAMNSWPVYAYNPSYKAGQQLPTVILFAICVT